MYVKKLKFLKNNMRKFLIGKMTGLMTNESVIFSGKSEK